MMEERLKKLLERAGEYVDRALGRGRKEFNVIRLIPDVQQAIERNLLADEKGVLRIAPNRLLVRLNYDLHSRLDIHSLKELEKAVLEIALQHVRDHRYIQKGELKAAVIADVMLTEPFAVHAQFEHVARSGRLLLRLMRDETITYPLGGLDERRRLTIGRSSDNDIVINDSSISRFHATISINDEGILLIADCGSANGTFVNGERVRTSRPVHPGDELLFGSVRMKLETVD